MQDTHNLAPMEFKDKVVWITGASSGIGEHLAYALADLKAHLVLSGRNLQELERVRNNCGSSARVSLYPFDITQFDRFPDIVRRVVEEFGFINLLINNAGLSQRAAALETTFAVDQYLMEVNYLGPVALTKAILPVMRRQQFGHIVVISSILGKVSVPRRSAYCASKQALHGFFDSLRAEIYRDNIPITLICPGYINTNLPLNALRGDGSPNTQTDQNRSGMEPAAFALKALEAIRRQRREVYIGGLREVLAVYLHRWLPALFARVVRRMDAG